MSLATYLARSLQVANVHLIAYSPGVGPVPFTASAEMFPLFIREVGMSYAVCVNLLGAGIIALVVQPLSSAIGHTGMLCFFMGLDLVGWALCYLFYPETARISLEELRAVFDVPLGAQARYRIIWLRYLWQYYGMWRKDAEQPEPLHYWYKDWSQNKLTKEEKKAMKKQKKEEERAAKEEKRRGKQQKGPAASQEEAFEEKAEPSQRRSSDIRVQLALEKERSRTVEMRNAELMRRIEQLEQTMSRSRSRGWLDVEEEEGPMGGGNSSTTFVPEKDGDGHSAS